MNTLAGTMLAWAEARGTEAVRSTLPRKSCGALAPQEVPRPGVQGRKRRAERADVRIIENRGLVVEEPRRAQAAAIGPDHREEDEPDGKPLARATRTVAGLGVDHDDGSASTGQYRSRRVRRHHAPSARRVAVSVNA